MPAAVKVSPRRKQDESPTVAPRRRLPAFSGRIPAAALLIVIVGLALFLVDLLRKRALQAEYFRVDPRQIELGDLPDFVPERIAAEIRALTQVAPRSIFDPDLIDDLKTSVGRHPWVKEVAFAHRILPNRIALELRLRAPAAVVEVGAWRVTVDADGSVLDDHASLAPEGLLHIRGDKKSIPRIPRVGSPFRCQPVVDGLAVVSDLRKNSSHAVFRYVDIAAVDVTNVGSKRPSEIVLDLGHGTFVDWGSAPTGALGPLELPASRKLDNLLLVHDKNPGMQGVARINAATQDPFVTLSQ